MTSNPATSGSVCNPDSVAETPFTYCRYVGRKVIAPSIAKPTMNAENDADAEDRGAEQAQRQDRVDGLPLDQHEDGQRHQGSDDQPDDRRRCPRVLGPAPRQRQGEPGSAERDEGDPR